MFQGDCYWLSSTLLKDFPHNLKIKHPFTGKVTLLLYYNSFIVNFEKISRIALAFPLLNLNK